MADKGLRSGKALQKLVGEPERWVNPLLLTVNICQTIQATITGIVRVDAKPGTAVLALALLPAVRSRVISKSLDRTRRRPRLSWP